MFERGALLLVPFPFSDLSAAKRRPVVALTGPDAHGDFIALPVTSRPQPEHGLALAPADLVSGSLDRPIFHGATSAISVSSTSCNDAPTSTGSNAHR